MGKNLIGSSSGLAETQSRNFIRGTDKNQESHSRDNRYHDRVSNQAPPTNELYRYENPLSETHYVSSSM
jgi:hypothetical protein